MCLDSKVGLKKTILQKQEGLIWTNFYLHFRQSSFKHPGDVFSIIFKDFFFFKVWLILVKRARDYFLVTCKLHDLPLSKSFLASEFPYWRN